MYVRINVQAAFILRMNLKAIEFEELFFKLVKRIIYKKKRGMVFNCLFKTNL